MIKKLKNIFRFIRSKDHILITGDRLIEIYIRMDMDKARRCCLGLAKALKIQMQMEENLDSTKELIK